MRTPRKKRNEEFNLRYVLTGRRGAEFPKHEPTIVSPHAPISMAYIGKLPKGQSVFMDESSPLLLSEEGQISSNSHTKVIKNKARRRRNLMVTLMYLSALFFVLGLMTLGFVELPLTVSQ